MNCPCPATRQSIVVTVVVAVAAMLAACDPVVRAAQAQPTAVIEKAPTSMPAAHYFGTEYATVQQSLREEPGRPAPTF